MSADRHRDKERLSFWVTREEARALRELAGRLGMTTTGKPLAVFMREVVNGAVAELGERQIFDRRSTEAPVDVDRRQLSIRGRREYDDMRATVRVELLLAAARSRRQRGSSS